MTITYANEMLDQIEKASGEAKVNLLKKFGAQSPLNMILSLNFDETIELDLPEGTPPYNRDEVQHQDLFPASLGHEIKRLGTMIKGKTNLPKIKREHIFIQVLEGIPPKEADVLIFAKDKSLGELYPSITKDFVAAHFPIYCRSK